MSLQPHTTPIFTRSAEAAEIIKAFHAKEIGDIITHEELGLMAGGDHREYMQTVIRGLLLDGIAIGNVRKVGYKVLSRGEVLDKGKDFRSRIRRCTKRRVQELKTINPDEITDPTELGQYHQEVTHTAMLHHLHSKDCQKRIGSAASIVKPAPGESLTLSQLRDIYAPAFRNNSPAA